MFAPALAIVGFPTAPLQTAFNHCEVALTEIFTHGFRLSAKGHNIHVADLISPLLILSVAPIDREAEAGYRCAVRSVAHLRISRQVSE
jgi:hypothetical protein